MNEDSLYNIPTQQWHGTLRLCQTNLPLINAAVSRYRRWWTAWIRYGSNFSCLSLCEYLSQIDTPCVPKFCLQLVCCLCQDKNFWMSQEQQHTISKMNTRCALQYIMFGPAQLSRYWREQRPSNRVTSPRVFGRVWGTPLHKDGPDSGLIFVP